MTRFKKRLTHTWDETVNRTTARFDRHDYELCIP